MDEEEDSNNSNFLSRKSVDDFVKDIMISVKDCQRISTELQGWQHYKDYPAVQPAMEQVNERIVSLITSIFSHSDIKLKLSHNRLTDQFDMVREGNDALLERTNSAIDEASGLKKQPALQFVDSTIKTVKRPLDRNGRQVVLMAAKNIQKPQLFFTEKINNSKKEPFIPLIKDKPNSLKPLSIITSLDEDGREFIEHPYKYELEHWLPPASQLQAGTVTNPLKIDETPMVKVETEEGLQSMIHSLKLCSEISIDLEHHGFRSYQGLTCLLQISTRSVDYIVDTLALRGKLSPLNEVFTDPKIIKVLHGADHDILWLQRDCGVYIVNLFDTHQAAVVLDYPQRSLAALLHHFCDIEANKVYQRADWRTRPLPIDFIDYARQDTHYLLYIFDNLRNELVTKGNELNNLIDAVYKRSTEICTKRYEKPFVDDESYLNLYRRSRKFFNNRQVCALQKLYIWRDNVARDHDESVDFVLPKHMLLQIAEVLPKEMQGILACCNPIPPLIKTELLTLHNIIRSAREQPLNKAIEMQNQLCSVSLEASDDLASSIVNRHDLSQVEENMTGLPCLLDKQETLLGDLFSETKPIKTKKASLLFGCVKKNFQISKNTATKTENFMSPYERYLAFQEIKPILEDGKNRKPQAGDVERLNRVREHLMNVSAYSLNNSSTNDTETTKEAESRSPTEQQPSDFNEDKDNRISGLFHYLKNLHMPSGESFTPDLSKKPSTQENIESTEQIVQEDMNTETIQTNSKHEKLKAKNLARKQALKEKRRKKLEAVVLNNEIKKQKKKKMTNKTEDFLPELLNEGIASVSETNSKKGKKKDNSIPSNLTILENIDNTIPDSEESKPKKRKKTNKKQIETNSTTTVIENTEHCKKRKSSEGHDDGVKKLKVNSQSKSTNKCLAKNNILDETNSEKLEEVQDIDSPESNRETNDSVNSNVEEETENSNNVDYANADYSVFENKKQSKKKQKKLQEKFKTTNQKGKGFKKSGMKCLTWGGGSKKK